ncbi:PREDICTED: FBD-associated F-box protein At3g52670-like [Erythranthe guttata]|uniref:FBD-associated F-box protein At3g52670-like n=1 Tax=Erythranthe guttata TaxID=4155 RepID=UPI00064DE726|nr:PREDICTED: FBD-associated F-box protein At3g52670-like [Erythranthe guttata]|eukprot:XP_012842073.1 PREDICTED: FBD-associated F-box protein At3g52670-like [Erythranthe guttata]
MKKLHLIYAQYEANESLQHLLSGCPVLKELEIYLYVDYYHCQISSPTIKRLIVNLHFHDAEYDNQNYYHMLEINTPALVYLKFVDYSGQHIKCGALTSLIEADIDICGAKGERKDFLYSRSALEFIDTLHGVKWLKLDLLARTKICDSVFSTWKGKVSVT